MIYRLFFLSVLFFLPIPLAQADTAAQTDSSANVPPDLAPWVPWVKERDPEWRCARNQHAYQCTWPGTLRYDLSGSGAEFTLMVEMLREGAVPLPSSAGFFPRQISIKSESGNQISAPLSLTAGQLSVRLPRGAFEVRGSFTWSALPPEIPTPGSYGLVEVVTPGDLGRMRTRRGPQSIWLEKEESNPTTESLTLSVMRRIVDGSPLTIETLLRARISGRSRPLQISSILPPDSVPVTLMSPLPAQLSKDGALALQLLPGEYEVRLLSLMQQPVKSIKVPSISLESWPKEEVWSWQPDMGFRSVELAGGQAVHADLTQLPSDWKGGAAYVFGAGGEMRLNETRRGEQSQAPNSIGLNRQIWIDLEGPGATVLDQFDGQLNREFRINALPETIVGRATVDGQPALVTTDPKSKASGVELRLQALNMQVVSRLDDSRSLHATGWNTTADRIYMSINLPPSWKLLHVGGAVEAQGSWVDTWSLLHIFVSILLILSAYKLFGRTVALVLAISLILNHAEFLAPEILYIHLLLLAAWRLLTDGRESIWRTLSTILLAITYAAWALQSLAFAKLQFTQLLFPQLQAGTRYRTILQSVIFGLESSLFVWPLMLAALAAVLLALRFILNSKGIGTAILRIFLCGIGFVLLIVISINVLIRVSSTYTADSGPNMQRQQEYPYNMPQAADTEILRLESSGAGFSSLKRSASPAEKAANTAFSYQGKNLLSGPAVPSWRWRSHSVSIAAPVTPDHEIHFYLLPPGVSRFLSAIRAVLALALIVLLFRALGYTLGTVRRLGAISASAAFLAIFLAAPDRAQADTPSQELLDDLYNRVTQNRCDDDECTVIESAEISLADTSFKLELLLSSRGASFAVIPGPLEALVPHTVRLNGNPAVAMRRSDDGYLVMRTEPGRNTILLEGALSDPQALTIQFPQRPLAVSVNAPQWFVEGLSPSGSVQENLRFVRRAPEESGKQPAVGPASGAEGLHHWVRVRRNLTIGEQISVQTTVERIGNISREAHVRIPLLPREQVTSGAVSIENNELLIGFSVDEGQSSFTSVLPYAAEIELKARAMLGVSEDWRVSCQPIVTCDFSGISPTATTLSGVRAFNWLPFPEEHVGIKIQPLTGLRGDFVTVDTLSHEVRWGANLLEGTLSASVRATQQSSFTITAPADAAIREVTLDRQAGQSTEKGSDSSVLLSPGAHQITLSYTKPWSPGLKETVPPLAISAPANNVTVAVRPSEDRWLLWTGGLEWGPCVVFWAKMLLVMAICIALARLGLIPGTQTGAAMLGIGLSTLPLIFMVVPLGWLAALMIIPAVESRLYGIPKWIRTTGFVLLSIVSIAIWYGIVRTGLVLSPPMLIAGNGSSAGYLRWYTDHVQGALPVPWVISFPIWCWRVVALLWSTWLVIALFGWLRRFVAIMRSGFVHLPKPVVQGAGEPVPPPAAAD